MKRFRYILLLGFVLLLAQESMAQWKVGIYGGGLISKFNTDEDPDYDSDYRLGYSAHLYLETQYTNFFGLSFEPGFIVKGNKVNYKGVTYTTSVQYVTMPVMANLHFLKIFTLAAGTELSILAQENYKGDVDNVDFEKEDFNDVEFSGLFAVYVTPVPKFDLGLRYGFAISNTSKLEKKDVGGFVEENATQAEYVQLVLRLRFN